MATNSYLSKTGLEYYNSLIQSLMDTKDETILSSAKTYADDAITNAAENYDAAGQAKTLVDALADGQVAANTAAIATLNGDETQEGSVAKALTDLKSEISASAYDDTALTARVSANEDAIEVLNGDSTVEGSVAAQVAQIVADAPEAYDTLKEIASWITTHADSASAMNEQINTNTSDISELAALVGTLPEGITSTTVIAYVAEAIAAVDTGVNEVVSGTTNGTISVDGAEVRVTGLGSAAYTSSDAYDVSGAADAALSSAKTYTDEALATLEEITAEEIMELFITETEEA